MDNISSMIGALELGDHLESYSDGALESVVASIGVTALAQYCTRAVCVSDGALESAGTNAQPGTHGFGTTMPLRPACC
jgi:hypothetical protein